VWDVGQRYQPGDVDALKAEIEAKESELDEMVAGFFRLPNAVQDRVSKKMEALQAEIDRLKTEVADLRTPWEALSAEVRQRYEALAYAGSLDDVEGPRRAQALSRVVDKIVCHFRYNGAKSHLDALEIHPVGGECFTELRPDCFRVGNMPGRG